MGGVLTTLGFFWFPLNYNVLLRSNAWRSDEMPFLQSRPCKLQYFVGVFFAGPRQDDIVTKSSL